jgi:hypothetical protein
MTANQKWFAVVFLGDVMPNDESQALLNRAPQPHATTIKTVPSGTIDLVEGGDGVFLQFNCDCLDALPYCHARCCALTGITLDFDEALTGKYEYDMNDREAELKRGADGYCIYNSRKNHLCTIYKDRPWTCQTFHCSRGVGMRGFRLGLSRLEDDES